MIETLVEPLATDQVLATAHLEDELADVLSHVPVVQLYTIPDAT